MASPGQAPESLVDKEEIGRFSRISSDWWDPNGPFRPLHIMNPVRLAYMRGILCQRHGRSPRLIQALDGIRVLDVGCGGGLVAEALARQGAIVTGVDADEGAITAAKIHAAERGISVTYLTGGIVEASSNGQKYQVVAALEVIEHTTDPVAFVQSLASTLAPGGTLLFSTLNRTAKSFATAIIAAEYVFGLLPRGTHDWQRFIRPSEMVDHLHAAGLFPGGFTGITHRPLSGGFALDDQDLSVNYIGWASAP